MIRCDDFFSYTSHKTQIIARTLGRGSENAMWHLLQNYFSLHVLQIFRKTLEVVCSLKYMNIAKVNNGSSKLIQRSCVMLNNVTLKCSLLMD